MPRLYVCALSFLQVAHITVDSVLRSHAAIEASNLYFIVHNGAKLTVKARSTIVFTRSEVSGAHDRMIGGEGVLEAWLRYGRGVR